MSMEGGHSVMGDRQCSYTSTNLWVKGEQVRVKCICLTMDMVHRLTLQLVRGTPTAGVLLHWVIISRRWELNQKRDSE